MKGSKKKIANVCICMQKGLYWFYGFNIIQIAKSKEYVHINFNPHNRGCCLLYKYSLVMCMLYHILTLLLFILVFSSLSIFFFCMKFNKLRSIEKKNKSEGGVTFFLSCAIRGKHKKFLFFSLFVFSCNLINVFQLIGRFQSYF